MRIVVSESETHFIVQGGEYRLSVIASQAEGGLKRVLYGAGVKGEQ